MFEISLENKLAWVTGSSRGIGKQVALFLARAGADVVVSYRSNEVEAQKVSETITKEYGRKAYIVQLDTSNFDSCAKAYNEIVEQSSSTIDILVNCAGITRDNLFLMTELKDWNDIVSTNLMGYVHTIKLVLQEMMFKRWGRIINISSVAATKGGRGQSNYAATKGAVEAMSRSLAVEVARQGVRVNCIAPGVIDTNMSEEVRALAKDEILKRQLIKRFGTPEEIAAWVLMLCSDYSDFITGTTIHIDGGLKMG